MLDHHLQRSIVYTLAFADSLRFSELQPDDIDSKLFTYHLKKVIAEGLAVKNSDGTYSLTPQGRRVGKGALKKQDRFIDRAYSILLLVVRRKSDGAWLLYTRNNQPLRGLSGFMQAQPQPDQDSAATAARALHTNTGLTGGFSYVSSGYFRIYSGDALESFTHFTLLACDDVMGDLAAHDELGEYSWQLSPNFDDPSMLPTAQTLSELYLHPDVTFVEETFRL